MTTPHQSTAEAVLAATGPLGFDPPEDTEAAEPEAIEAEAPEVEAPEDATEQPEVEADGKLSWRDALTRIEAIDPRAAGLMKQMQGDYTRKTQEAAAMRKEAQAERAALLKGKRELEQLREELPEYDPWNESSMKARIEHEVQVRLNALLEPMQQEYEVQQAEQSYNAFLSEHPDFETDTGLRTDVQQMLEANTSLDLETAYWAVMGQAASRLQAVRGADAVSKCKACRQATEGSEGHGHRAQGAWHAALEAWLRSER
jgi:hypothetical protein